MNDAIINLIWILLAAVIGFGIAAVFAGFLKLPRNVYLLFYIPLSLMVFGLFSIFNDLNLINLITYHWEWGLIGAFIITIILIRNVLSQPSSPRHKGFEFIIDIIWPGVAYGFVDALLLTILPILAVREAYGDQFLFMNWTGKLGFGAFALLASLFVTAIYHLGYPEFRNRKVFWTMFGNGIMSLAYIISMNPLAAIIPHVLMHISAMIHGRKTAGQVPPHYEESSQV